ncbi:MAG: aconitate hydratase AcnA, partial [Armatimonadetes bacterium]|nr:aconitate hydratase AcnA [Armatimonadota bacterium]
RWGQQAFRNFRVVPPGTGICHQVNLEYLSRAVWSQKGKAKVDGKVVNAEIAYPDTLVGTDSHTTMINGLAVLGWGVGGIEAEAAMLGQPISMLIPQVVGFRLTGELAEGATATDLVLRVTQMLRERGVVGKFVEFVGSGVANLSLADRATIANMAPEYGATCGIFPVDDETLRFLRFTGRDEEQIALVEAYMKEQGLFFGPDTPEPVYTDLLELDLSTVRPALAGPKRPQDRVPLEEVPASFRKALSAALGEQHDARPRRVTINRWEGEGGEPSVREQPTGTTGTIALERELEQEEFELGHGAVVIAAITSCTNTSNPSVMLGAGLLARKAVARGLQSKPWVKTSLSPGSKAVTEYLSKAGVLDALNKLRFNLAGYGCMTCIGNSGPLPPPIAAAVEEGDLVVTSVLSGNRNFEGRIHPLVRANYLASPPLVVAYALAGRIDIDWATEPLGEDQQGRPVFLHEIWPTQAEVNEAVRNTVDRAMYASSYADVYRGDDRWANMAVPTGDTYAWDPDSTYVKHPPYFTAMPAQPAAVADIAGARVLAVLGDSVTTDHISPAGSIKADSPAGRYLQDHGVAPADFNSYGSRRGNHEVMMRGTFANVRLRNALVPGVEGGFTCLLPSGEQMAIYDAAMRYAEQGVPLLILAGKEYGSGSSRDWAAKGPALLGVRAVIAESYERIHRSNLIGMGVVPLQFADGASVASYGLTGRETFAIDGLAELIEGGLRGSRVVKVTASPAQGAPLCFEAKVRIDTPQEAQYYRHGGILHYVLRQLLA